MDKIEKEKKVALVLKQIQKLYQELDKLNALDDSETDSHFIDTDSEKELNQALINGVCNNIRKIRIQKQITHETLGELARINSFHECKIESEKKNIKITTAIKIAKALGIDMNTLCNVIINGNPFFANKEENKDKENKD